MKIDNPNFSIGLNLCDKNREGNGHNHQVIWPDGAGCWFFNRKKVLKVMLKMVVALLSVFIVTFSTCACSSSSKKDAADNYETKVAKRNDKKGESKASSERRANKILMVKRCWWRWEAGKIIISWTG